MHDIEKYISGRKSEDIINTLEPYFQNKENIYKFSNEGQIIRAYAYLIKYGHFSLGIKEILLCYNDTLQINKEDTISIFAVTMETASSKENIMHSARKSTQSTDNIHDIVLSRFRLIGDILEVSVKYIIIEILALLKLKSESVDYRQLMNTNFGSAIQYFLDKNKLKELMLTSPVRIRLSDWRNIAQHHSFIVQKKEIICEYKKNNKFRLSLNELNDYVYQIVHVSNMLNIARVFFFYDNFDDILEAGKKMQVEPPLLRSAVHEENNNILLLARKYGVVE